MAVTTTVESVEPSVADTTSYSPEFSTTIEGFPPVLAPGQNVETENIETIMEAESFSHELVAPEPSFRHSFVEPQNKRPELTNGAVCTLVNDLELPATSDSTVNVQAPLSFRQESQEANLELGAETKAADEIVADDSPNGSAEQALKTPETFEQSADLVKGANTLGVKGANQTTVAKSLTETPLAEPLVETAPSAVEQVAVTPTNPLLPFCSESRFDS